MSGIANPTPAQVVAAIRDHGVPLRLYRGWDTRGRSWSEGGGLQAVMNHHTSTASATGSTGAPSLEWCVTATSRGACNLLIGRGRSDVWLITAGSAFHSGNGGPWPALKVPSGNSLHLRCFGIEIDDAGVRIGSMTDTQIEMTGRVNAAICDLAGLDASRIVTHQSWTDGIDGVNPVGGSPYKGRKNDTLRPADGKGPYSATFWRTNAAKYRNGPKPPTPPTPPPPPLPQVSLPNVMPGKSNGDVLIVQKALAQTVGLDYSSAPGTFGPRTRAAYSRWQQSLGYSGADADGVPGRVSLTALGKRAGFTVAM